MTDVATKHPSLLQGPMRPLSDIKVSVRQMHPGIDRYISQDFLRLEQEKLWPHVWQLVCREDEVAEPGDYYEHVFGHQSYLVVRTQSGELRGMHNVCPHRANILKSGAGNTGKAIVCQFHMWSFNLDGSLRSISDRNTFCELNEADYDLKPVSVDTWAGWIFIHPDPSPDMSLLDYLAPLPELIDPYHLEHLVPVGLNLTTTVSANWKVCVEAFLEVYHVHALHPQLLPNGDDQNVQYEHFERHNRMTRPFGIASPRLGEVETEEILEALYGPPPNRRAAAPSSSGNGSSDDSPARPTDPNDRRSTATGGGSGDYFRPVAHDVGSPWNLVEQYRDESGAIDLPEGVELRDILRDFYMNAGSIKGVDFSGLGPDQFVDNFHWLLFPNVLINTNVGSILFMRFTPHADDPNVCTWDLITFDWMMDKERAKAVRAPRKVIAEKAESLGLLLDQDVSQMPRVQRGLRSGTLDHLTLSKQETRLIHFNEVLDRYLGQR